MESRAIPSAAYEPLLPPEADTEAQQQDHHRGLGWRVCVSVLAACAVVALIVAATLLAGARMGPADAAVNEDADADADGAFAWSNEMLQWQRAGFHFQPPEGKFMSDPNGPVYYRGYYHLFYQYNPMGVAWDDGMVWAHVVSRDLLHWKHLPSGLGARPLVRHQGRPLGLHHHTHQRLAHNAVHGGLRRG